jgi:general secretion pathway protein K
MIKQVPSPKSQVPSRRRRRLVCRTWDLGPGTWDSRGERGGVLLLVLWVTAALSFVALSTAMMVRTEAEATGYRVEAEQARWIARGGIEQTMFALQHPDLRNAEDKPLLATGQRRLELPFATGRAQVRLMPEAARMNVNVEPAKALAALLQAVGLTSSQAEETAEAIADWRAPRSSEIGSVLDNFYAGLAPPYQAAHRPFARIQELLLVKGITPEILYGWIERDEAGRLWRHGGLARLLTVYGDTHTMPSLNESPYELLLCLPGMDAERARAIVAGRRQKPYATWNDLPLPLPPEATPSVMLWAPDNGYLRVTATGEVTGSSTHASVSVVLGAAAPGSSQRRIVEWEEQADADEALEPREGGEQEAEGSRQEAGRRKQ